MANWLQRPTGGQGPARAARRKVRQANAGRPIPRNIAGTGPVPGAPGGCMGTKAVPPAPCRAHETTPSWRALRPRTLQPQQANVAAPHPPSPRPAQQPLEAPAKEPAGLRCRRNPRPHPQTNQDDGPWRCRLGRCGAGATRRPWRRRARRPAPGGGIVGGGDAVAAGDCGGRRPTRAVATAKRHEGRLAAARVAGAAETLRR